MRYFQRKMIGFAAVMAFTLVYAPLRQFPFGVDAAICPIFTVLVFGNALRRHSFGLFSGDDAKPLSEILLVHACCLTALVVLVRIGMYITPFLPDWLSAPMGRTNRKNRPERLSDSAEPRPLWPGVLRIPPVDGEEERRRRGTRPKSLPGASPISKPTA